MNIAALKKASTITQVLDQLSTNINDYDHIKKHISTRYQLEAEANDSSRALKWAKQRIVSANGGTTKQWLAFSA